MNWDILISEKARQDLLQAKQYMIQVLKNPNAALRFLKEAEKKINTLAVFPEKFAYVSDPVLASWGIRCTQINNYLAFYILSEHTHQVTIIRILYRKSNWNAILTEDVND